MVVRAEPECSWCYLHGKERVPAKPWLISLDSEGGLYDLCDDCARPIVGPILAMRAAGLSRANRQTELPEGWIGSAWPGAKSTVPPPGQAAPLVLVGSSEPTVKVPAKRKPATKPAKVQRPPKHVVKRQFLCLLVNCRHTTETSEGIYHHLKTIHAGLKQAEMLEHVKVCGLCLTALPTVRYMGRHAANAHSDITGNLHNGHCVALITEVRRAGDPHGTLNAMDAWALNRESTRSANPQLALGDSADDIDDHSTREDH